MNQDNLDALIDARLQADAEATARERAERATQRATLIANAIERQRIGFCEAIAPDLLAALPPLTFDAALHDDSYALKRAWVAFDLYGYTWTINDTWCLTVGGHTEYIPQNDINNSLLRAFANVRNGKVNPNDMTPYQSLFAYRAE